MLLKSRMHLGLGWDFIGFLVGLPNKTQQVSFNINPGIRTTDHTKWQKIPKHKAGYHFCCWVTLDSPKGRPVDTGRFKKKRSAIADARRDALG